MHPKWQIYTCLVPNPVSSCTVQGIFFFTIIFVISMVFLVRTMDFCTIFRLNIVPLYPTKFADMYITSFCLQLQKTHFRPGYEIYYHTKHMKKDDCIQLTSHQLSFWSLARTDCSLYTTIYYSIQYIVTIYTETIKIFMSKASKDQLWQAEAQNNRAVGHLISSFPL